MYSCVWKWKLWGKQQRNENKKRMLTVYNLSQEAGVECLQNAVVCARNDRFPASLRAGRCGHWLGVSGTERQPAKRQATLHTPFAGHYSHQATCFTSSLAYQLLLGGQWPPYIRHLCCTCILMFNVQNGIIVAMCLKQKWSKEASRALSINKYTYPQQQYFTLCLVLFMKNWCLKSQKHGRKCCHVVPTSLCQ